MAYHNQTIHPQQPTNCLSVFDNFVWLTLRGLNKTADLTNEGINQFQEITPSF